MNREDHGITGVISDLVKSSLERIGVSWNQGNAEEDLSGENGGNKGRENAKLPPQVSYYVDPQDGETDHYMGVALKMSEELLQYVTENRGRMGDYDQLGKALENVIETADLLMKTQAVVNRDMLNKFQAIEGSCTICTSWKTVLVEAGSCGHKICVDCLSTYVVDPDKPLICPSNQCNRPVDLGNIEPHLSPENREIVLQKSLKQACGENLTSCTSCGTLMEVYVDEREQAKVESTRVRCTCGTTFCRVCKTTPFHENQICEQSHSHTPCRFCGAFSHDGACENSTCQRKRAELCGKIRPECGHVCGGYLGEPECIDICTECETGEICIICLDHLSTEASVKVSCGHYFHVQCLKYRFDEKTSKGRQVSFNAQNCPTCSKKFDSHGGIFEKEMKVMETKKTLIASMIENERAKLPDGLELNNNQFSFYQCYLCDQVFFGGLRNCEQEVDQDETAVFCPSCICMKNQTHGCETHGTDHLLYKCSFCCTPASFFCWGTTPFCEFCHARQMAGERLNHFNLSRFANCEGGVDCPLQIEHHPRNGITNSEPQPPFVLGCALCKAGI